MTAFTPISDNEANALNNAQTSAVQMYYKLLSTKGKNKALADVVAFLKGQVFVQDAGVSVSGTSIWIEYKNGMEGVLALHPPGTSGGPPLSALSRNPGFFPAVSAVAAAAPPGNIEVQSTKVLILSPFLDEFSNPLFSVDSGAAVNAIYENHNKTVGCPHYNVKYLPNSKADVEAFKTLGSYGIVHISSHGVLWKDQVLIATKTPSSEQNLRTYQGDLVRGSLIAGQKESLFAKIKRLVIGSTNSGNFLLVTTAFFSSDYIQNMPSSLVFVAACESADNSSMWDALKAKGAKSYLGFSGVSFTAFTRDTAKYFYENWIEDPTTLVTTGQVYNGGGCDKEAACSGCSKACWQLMEDTNTNLEAPSSSGLQDGGFETGALGAWTAAGDVRVHRKLGQLSPVEGSYFGLVSTGIGFTSTSGSMEQKFCLPANARKLEFRWNFNSEEFVEYCGSRFQDTFGVDMVTNTETRNLFSVKVDDLCSSVKPSDLKLDQSQGTCTPTPGVGFGTGGNDCTVWTTDWQSKSIDVSGIAAMNQNKAVTLRFSAHDVGDSIFDSAIAR